MPRIPFVPRGSLPQPAALTAARERSRILGDVRAIAADLPRRADAAAVVRAARRLARAAAQDEFAREGVRLLTLPATIGRAELRRADLPGDAAFQQFVQDTIGALALAPSALEADDARALLRSPTSRDGYGLGPEAAADLVSYLLGRAWALQELDRAEEGAGGEPTLLPAGAARTEEEFVAEQAATVREEVREALVRLVRTPIELQIAVRRHEEVEAGTAPEPPAAEQGARVPLDAAWRFASSETGRKAFGAANDLYRSETGRKVFHAAKDGAGKLRQAYDRRGEGR